MTLYSNIIYKNGISYQILDIVNVHNFLNSNDTINQKVLGMYVHEKGGDHVLQRDNKFLICQIIEEATVVEENV